MARYRLRFLLQEFDLPRGPTLIGRSTDCQVTIEDPLVSRQHARIVLEEDTAKIEDLGSRNGVKLNGVSLRGSAELKDGDRLRIGTQELVFCLVESESPLSRGKTTGFLRHCANCRLPYPEESLNCPNCGSSDALDESRGSGQFGASAQVAWSLQLLVEVIEKAMSLSRATDVDRLLRRATSQIDERLEAGEAVDSAHLAGLVVVAIRWSAESGDQAWARWGAQVYLRLGMIPPLCVVEKWVELASSVPPPPQLAQPVEQLAKLSRVPGRALTPDETQAAERLEQLCGLLSEEAALLEARTTAVDPVVS